MSQRWLGGYITNNPTEPTSTVANGVWTLAEQVVHKAAGNWPTLNKNPDAISGLAAWHRANSSNVTKDGSNNVSQWNDSSGNVRHLTTASNYPLWVGSVINGQPVIRFDGVNDIIENSSVAMALTQPYHMFFVGSFSCDSVAGTAVHLDHNTTGAAPAQLRLTAANAISAQGNSNTTSVGGTVLTADVPYLVECFFNGTSGGTCIVNAGQMSGSTSSDLSATTEGMTLGCRATSANNPLAFDVAEIALYNAEITDVNLYGLRQYFRDRYALF